IGTYIKIFPWFHAAERGAHDIARMITASASGHDADIKGPLHDVTDGFYAEMMKLDGLACGDVRQIHIIFAAALTDKGQLFFGHHALIHAQPEHEPLAAALGIRTKAAGISLEILHGDLFAHKLIGRFTKLSDFFLQL